MFFFEKTQFVGWKGHPTSPYVHLRKQKVIPGMLSFQSMSNSLDLVPTRVCLTQMIYPKKTLGTSSLT